jgi:hypothetical protein
MSFTDNLENKLLDHVLGGGDYARPGTVYIGLSTTTPNDDGTNFTEPTGNGYARAAVTNNATEWPAASGGSKSNANDITFAQATGDWASGADFTHFGIFDGAGEATLLATGALTNERPVSIGDIPVFRAGEIVVTLD